MCQANGNQKVTRKGRALFNLEVEDAKLARERASCVLTATRGTQSLSVDAAPSDEPLETYITFDFSRVNDEWQFSLLRMVLDLPVEHVSESLRSLGDRVATALDDADCLTYDCRPLAKEIMNVVCAELAEVPTPSELDRWIDLPIDCVRIDNILHEA